MTADAAHDRSGRARRAARACARRGPRARRRRHRGAAALHRAVPGHRIAASAAAKSRRASGAARRPDQWHYETRAFPNLFGAHARSARRRANASTMQVTPDGVRPLVVRLQRRHRRHRQGRPAAFDWAAKTASPVERRQAGDARPVARHAGHGLGAGRDDSGALAGRKPTSFRIVTDGKMREYPYWTEGTQQVMTPFGTVDAEIWASQRNGSTRVLKAWHAPSLGYVPVQAIQYRKGKAEMQMKLVQAASGSAADADPRPFPERVSAIPSSGNGPVLRLTALSAVPGLSQSLERQTRPGKTPEPAPSA